MSYADETATTAELLIEAAQCIEEPEGFDHQVLCQLLYERAYALEGEHEHLERLEREREIETCCQGRNVNCGHHWGRGR